MNIINFSHPFAPETFEAIEKHFGKTVNVENVKVQIDMTEDAPPIEEQMLELLKSRLSEFNGTKRIVIAVPGMPAAAIILSVAIHALSGFFPEIIELRMNSEKVFAFHRIIDLQELRNETRKLR